MTTRSAARGNRFEREIHGYLAGHFGQHLGRPRPGRARDIGDVLGIADWTVEIKALVNLQESVSRGMRDLDREQHNAGTPHGALIVKRVGIADPAQALFVTDLATGVECIQALQRTANSP